MGWLGWQSATEAVSNRSSQQEEQKRDYATLLQLPSSPLPGACFPSPTSASSPQGKSQPSNGKGGSQDSSAAATGLLRENRPVRRVLRLHGLRSLPQQLRQQDTVVLFRWSLDPVWRCTVQWGKHPGAQLLGIRGELLHGHARELRQPGIQPSLHRPPGGHVQGLNQHVLQRVLHGRRGVCLPELSSAELRQQGPVDHRDRSPMVDDLRVSELPGLLRLPGPRKQRVPWLLLHERLPPLARQRCLLDCHGLPLQREALPRQPQHEDGEWYEWLLQLSLMTLSTS